MSFSEDITRFVGKAKKNQDQFMQQFSQELMFRIVENTPVKTGFLVNSWTPYIGKDEALDENGVEDKSKSIAYNRIGLVVLNLKMGDVLTYINTAEYGIYVEFGTSKQAGQAFVRNTVVQADSIAQKVANKILKGGIISGN